jgi:hypothetical protein
VHLNDPESHELGPILGEYSKTDPELEFLGKLLDDKVASQIA